MSDDVASRCLWRISEERDHFLVLENNALVTGATDHSKVDEVTAAFEAMQSVAPLLQNAIVIPIDTVICIEADVKKHCIDIKRKSGDDKESLWEFIYCKDVIERESVMNGLMMHLGKNWDRKLEQEKRWDGAKLPLILIAIFGFLAYCMYMAATDQTDAEPHIRASRPSLLKAAFYWAATLLGPTVLFIIFLSLLAPLVYWLIFAIMSPPMLDRLLPRSNA